MKIKEAKILITGGGKGIGRKLIEQFLKINCKVYVFEKNKDLIIDLKKNYENLSISQCDVSKDESVAFAMKEMLDKDFNPNVLINNAGIIHSEPLVNITKKFDKIHSRANWRKVISVDLDSVFFVTSRFCEDLISKRRRGLIISISSIAANGNSGQTAYSAAKAGVNALTKTWSKELGSFGLRFASISPGFLDTDSTRTALSNNQIKEIERKIPLKKFGDAENIFETAKFLIENEYLTGNIIDVNGGLVI